MAASSQELYELFLALTPARIEAARAALAIDDPGQRASDLASALIPLAVDAALLGADGLSELARAAAARPTVPTEQLASALDALQTAAQALSGEADASGARTDEGALLVLAKQLRGTSDLNPPGAVVTPGPQAPLHPPAQPSPAVRDAVPVDLEPEDPSETNWVPQLADDMIAAFLDECVERTEGLSERLIALEESGGDPELVDEIFRDLHTLKGSSAFAGLKKMNRVAHRAEDLIGELRDGKRECDQTLVDLLLETLDVLRAILDRARARQPIDLDVRDLVRRLSDPSATPLPVASPQDTAPASVRRGPAAPVATGPSGGAAVRRPAPTAQATLRIDFAKVDLLLNLVGEAVLARGRLTAAAEGQASLLREFTQLRRKLMQELAEEASAGKASAHVQTALALVEDLRRTERVFQETYGDLDSGLGSLALAVGQLRDNVMKLRMVPISRLFTKYQRTARELSHKLGKEVGVELVGADTELDKVLVERLEDPLLHLVRNSVDHGVELPDVRQRAGKSPKGTVRLIAAQRGGQILVTIEDDGGGMDPEKLRAKALEKGLIDPATAASMTDEESFALIFQAGFSTAAQVSDVSGRGVGMDVVRDAIAKLKGAIHVDSTLGQGTRMELRLPLTLAITQVLTARVAGEHVAIPLDAVVSAQSLGEHTLEPVADGACLRLGELLVPVVDLALLLGLSQDVELDEKGESAVVIVDIGTDRLGLMVQAVLSREEVVIKSLGPMLSAAPCSAGATLIGNRVLLVVDLAAVARRAKQPGVKAASVPPPRRPAKTRARVLVAEDSDVVRETIRRELVSAGFEVCAVRDGAEALSVAQREEFDAVSTDVMMPNLDGYDLTRALRRLPRYRHVPIVMVTSKDERIDSMRGHDAGADVYLTKPSGARELIEALENLLQRVTGGSGSSG